MSRSRPLRWREDHELLDAAVTGNRDAMTLLLERHYDRVALIARRMMSDRSDAEDATQQALIAIVRGIAGFDGRSAVSTWIHRVTVNACLDEIRRRGRRPEPVEISAVSEAPSTPEPDHAVSVVDRAVIDEAMKRLAADFRAAVVLRDVCGLDYDEIAEVLEVPGGTVRSRISRGRRELRALLGNPGVSRHVEEMEP